MEQLQVPEFFPGHVMYTAAAGSRPVDGIVMHEDHDVIFGCTYVYFHQFYAVVDGGLYRGNRVFGLIGMKAAVSAEH